MAALDVHAAPLLRRLLKRVLAGRRAIIVTHDVLDAYMLADRVIVLEGGRIAEEGPVREVLQRPRSSFAAGLAGLNLVAGTVTADGHPVRRKGWKSPGSMTTRWPRAGGRGRVPAVGRVRLPQRSPRKPAELVPRDESRIWNRMGTRSGSGPGRCPRTSPRPPRPTSLWPPGWTSTSWSKRPRWPSTRRRRDPVLRAGYSRAGRTGCWLTMETRLKAFMVIASQLTAENSSAVRCFRACGAFAVARVGVGNVCHGLGQGQGGALLLREEVRVPPCGENGQALGGLAILHSVTNMQVQAEGAAVDLRNADVQQLDQGTIEACILRRFFGFQAQAVESSPCCRVRLVQEDARCSVFDDAVDWSMFPTIPTRREGLSRIV